MNENDITWDENDGLKHYNHVEGCPAIPNGYISDKFGGFIKEENDQTAKADAGKPRLSLVPLEMILQGCGNMQ